MTVVGIDLSLTSTGVAWIDGDDRVDFANVKTVGRKNDSIFKRGLRLQRIADQVLELVMGDDTELVVIEAPSYGSRFGSAHDRAGVWWLVVSALIEERYPVALVPPQVRAKYATGSGGAGKDVVVAHVIERYSDQIGRRIPNDDVADAIVLAAMGARFLGDPVERYELPPDNLDAMNGAHWPPDEEAG